MLSGRGELPHVHLEGSIPGHANDVLIRAGELHPDGACNPRPHASLGPRRHAAIFRSAEIGGIIGPKVLGAVFVDQDRVPPEDSPQLPDNSFRFQRHAIILAFRGQLFQVAGLLLLDGLPSLLPALMGTPFFKGREEILED